MDKDDRTGSSMQRVDQAARGSVQVPWWSGGNRWERLADMMRAVGSTYTWRSMDVFRAVQTRSSEKIEKGYFGNLTKYRLCDFCLNRSAGRRKVKWFRSIEDEDDALKCVRTCPVFVGP